MEDWISLLTLDSQTSSQIVSEEFLKRIAEDLKEAIPISKDNFETLTKALSDKFTCFEFNDVPADFYRVLRCLCSHLVRRDDVVPLDIRNFFLNFVEILSSLNEITVISSAKKVELFLKPKVFTTYTLLASNLRAIGDYDTQTQLLEFLLHVIPSARRRFFVERYIHPDFADPFCAIIGQNFTTAARKFLNLLNPTNPTTQSVFSLPCIGIQICGHELPCQSAVDSQSDDDHFWIDFNLVPQRITANCILAAQSAQPSHTVAIFTKDERGTPVEQINLSITTFESPSEYVRFWESDSPPHHTPEEELVTIEFCLDPHEVVKNAPTKAPEIPVSKNDTEASQSQEQQLTGLLTGLRAYAEQMIASSSAISPQSTSKGSENFSQQQRAPLKFKYVLATCKSPLPVDVGKAVNSQATTPLPPPPLPKPKSFFTDPDISFEESAEGLGLHIPYFSPQKSPEKPMTRPKPQLKHQTVRTPLGVHISTEESSSARMLSSRAPSSRSVNSPYSVVSGLETPTRTGICKTLEVPNLDTIDLNSSDEDIASVSHNKLSSEERLTKEIEEDE
nr:hypothetical transcript [Hymenolepis microstoma]